MSRKCGREVGVWQLAESQEPDWRLWDGTYVVFNSLSGETHTLDIASGAVLMRIMEGPTIFQAVQSELGLLLQVENSEDLSEATAAILNGLDEIGLIERVN